MVSGERGRRKTEQVVKGTIIEKWVIIGTGNERGGGERKCKRGEDIEWFR